VTPARPIADTPRPIPPRSAADAHYCFAYPPLRTDAHWKFTDTMRRSPLVARPANRETSPQLRHDVTADICAIRDQACSPALPARIPGTVPASRLLRSDHLAAAIRAPDARPRQIYSNVNACDPARNALPASPFLDTPSSVFISNDGRARAAIKIYSIGDVSAVILLRPLRALETRLPQRLCYASGTHTASNRPDGFSASSTRKRDPFLQGSPLCPDTSRRAITCNSLLAPLTASKHVASGPDS